MSRRERGRDQGLSARLQRRVGVSVSEIGLGVRGDHPWDEYAALAALADEAGVAVISVFGDLYFAPAIAPLLEMAARTSRVRLGPACLNPYTMHPVEIAGAVAALDQASRGRAYLGLAAGSWLSTLGITPKRPLQAVRDTVEIVSRLLRGDAGGYRGAVFGVEPDARLRQPVWRAQVPLLIGTWSPGLARLGGMLADEVKLGGSANPEALRRVAGWVREGETRAGRRPGTVGMVLGAVTVVDEDGAAARARARTQVAMYVDVVAERDPAVDWPPELRARLRELVRAGDHEGAGRLIPDADLGRFSLAGTPAEVADRTASLLYQGARRIEWGPPYGLERLSGLRLLLNEVLRRLSLRPDLMREHDVTALNACRLERARRERKAGFPLGRRIPRHGAASMPVQARLRYRRQDGGHNRG